MPLPIVRLLCRLIYTIESNVTQGSKLKPAAPEFIPGRTNSTVTDSLPKVDPKEAAKAQKKQEKEEKKAASLAKKVGKKIAKSGPGNFSSTL